MDYETECAQPGPFLILEMEWLSEMIAFRISQTRNPDSDLPPSPPPIPDQAFSEYEAFILERKPGIPERLCLVLALSVHLNPNLLNPLYADPGIFRQSKMIRSQSQNSLIPTGETVLFLLGGNHLAERFPHLLLFSTRHWFFRDSVLELARPGAGEPVFAGALALAPRYRNLFMFNRDERPRYREEFPAELITTPLNWDDLILPDQTRQGLDEFKLRLMQYEAMVSGWRMELHARKGCKALFSGPSGTGKTLTATLTGKFLQADVYRVDLSQTVSKYIGETSKRLASLFNTAEKKNWVLFFDEGDALLGHRQDDAHAGANTHYANQDVAFLLQLIESYRGVVIVATNLPKNIDPAFTRRFDSQVKFSLPSPDQQVGLWQDLLPQALKWPAGFNLEQVCVRFPLAPAAIVNVMHRVCLHAWANQSSHLSTEQLMHAIRDEDLKNKGRRLPEFS